MKSFFHGAVATVMLAVPALAADMPVKAPPPVAVAAYSWSGCYVGAAFGYAWGTSKQTSPDGVFGGVVIPQLVGIDLTDKYRVKGPLVGGEAGCNYQTGNWVFGIEVDGSLSDAKGLARTSAAAIAQGINPIRQFTTEQNWLATARGRLGYSWDRWLLYVTGGAAVSGLDVNNDASLAGPLFNRRPNRISRLGWIAGLGSEYALGGGFSVKSEFLFADFGTLHYSDTPASNGCVQCFSANVKFQEVIVRVGVNYKFDSYSTR